MSQVTRDGRLTARTARGYSPVRSGPPAADGTGAGVPWTRSATRSWPESAPPPPGRPCRYRSPTAPSPSTATRRASSRAWPVATRTRASRCTSTTSRSRSSRPVRPWWPSWPARSTTTPSGPRSSSRSRRSGSSSGTAGSPPRPSGTTCRTTWSAPTWPAWCCARDPASTSGSPARRSWRTASPSSWSPPTATTTRCSTRSSGSGASRPTSAAWPSWPSSRPTS